MRARRGRPETAGVRRTLDPVTAAELRPRLVEVARRLCGSSQLAEDLAQETYVRVLARPRAVHEHGDFAYLVRTLRNVLTDHWRRERRRPVAAVEVAEHAAHDHGAALRAVELHRALA